MSRANSLKKAVRQLVGYMENAVDQQNTQGTSEKSSTKHELEVPTVRKTLKIDSRICIILFVRF